MEYTVKINENATAELDVTYSANEIEEAFDKAYIRANAKVKVNGFRQGKAPIEMVKKILGESVTEDAINILLADSIDGVIPSLSFKPYKSPKLEIIKYNRKEVLNVKAIYETAPDVTLGNYKGLEYINYSVLPSEEDIEEDLKQIQRQFSKTITREESETSQNTDVLDIDIESREGDQVVQNNTNQTYYIGMNPSQKVIDDNLIGLKLGEEKTFDYTYPDEVGPELAGKTYTFKVKVNSISKVVLPELDDNLAKEHGQFETIEELKAYYKKNIKDHFEKELKVNSFRSFLNNIVSSSTFNIPLSLLQDEKKGLFDRLKSDAKMPDLTVEKYAEILKISPEEVDSQFEKQAFTNLKQFLTIHKIAAEESLTITEEELDRVYELTVATLKTKPNNEFKRRILLNIHDNLVNQKVQDFLFANAKEKKLDEISVAKAVEIINSPSKET